jgi:hypothetical protein
VAPGGGDRVVLQVSEFVGVCRLASTTQQLRSIWAKFFPPRTRISQRDSTRLRTPSRYCSGEDDQLCICTIGQTPCDWIYCNLEQIIEPEGFPAPYRKHKSRVMIPKYVRCCKLSMLTGRLAGLV